MEQTQEEIKLLTFDASSGAGLVKMTMSGDYEIKSIELDDSIISSEDKSILTDLIIAAYNEARRKVKDTTEEKMKELTAGLPIPPGMKIPGMF